MTNILLVEDVKMYAKVINKTLGDILDYNVQTVGTVKEAKELLKKTKMDIVLLDVSLPDGSGRDVAKYIREVMGNKITYIIIITTETSESTILELYNSGIDYYIPKPFTPNFLKATVNRINERLKVMS